MSTIAKLSGTDFDRMVQRGAFLDLQSLKIELIRGELRFMNPAGPVHEGELEYLTNWSYANTNRDEVSLRIQCSIDCGDHRPEPDLVWSRKLHSKRVRPKHQDVLLIIEVADSSLGQDLGEKAVLYAEHSIPEYWVVDIHGQRVHVHRDPGKTRYHSVVIVEKTGFIHPLCQSAAELPLHELFDLDS